MTQALAKELASIASSFKGSGDITATPKKKGPVSQIREIRSGRGSLEDCDWMLPANIESLEREYADFRENRFDRRNQEDLKRYRDLIIAASDPTNVKAQRELAEYRKFEITSDVMAVPWSMAAFQTVPLRPGELPMIERPQSKNFNSFNVNSIGVDGGRYSAQWRTTLEVETMEMQLLTTDRVEYSIMDLQQGDISQVDAINQRLLYDLEMKMDVLAKTNIDAAKVVSGLQDTMNIHPSVVLDNIPDTNYIDLDTLHSGSTGKLTIEKFKSLLALVSKFGSAGGADVPIQMRSVMVSPQNLNDPWDFVSLVSGFSGGDAVEPKSTVPTAVRDQIFQTGMFTSAWGYNFNWTPNNQLDIGQLYIITDQPLGWVFTKPIFDKMLKWDETNSPDHAERNMAEMLYQKALRFVVPDEWRYRVIIADF
jgi:hypothetical protein